MAKKEEINQIVEYALEKDNLSLALKVGAAYDEIRKRIIVAFAIKLEKMLKDALDDEKEWIIDNKLSEDPFVNYTGLYLYKKKWSHDYGIAIEPQRPGARDFIIGICKDKNLSHMKESKLKIKLDQKYPSGSASDYWEWYRNIKGIYRDWDNEEALIKMHTGDEAVIYFKDNIIKIIDVATPVIDEVFEQFAQ